jgi:hypothetical protein
MKKLILLSLLLLMACGVFAQQTLFRYYNPQIRKHYYTIDFNEYGNGRDGWQLDGPACVVFDHDDRDRGILPLLRYFNPQVGDHYYTTRYGELRDGDKGYMLEHPEGYVSRFRINGTVPFLEFFNPHSGDHFYTINRGEVGNGYDGYVFSRVVGYVFPPRTDRRY